MGPLVGTVPLASAIVAVDVVAVYPRHDAVPFDTAVQRKSHRQQTFMGPEIPILVLTGQLAGQVQSPAMDVTQMRQQRAALCRRECFESAAGKPEVVPAEATGSGHGRCRCETFDDAIVSFQEVSIHTCRALVCDAEHVVRRRLLQCLEQGFL